ncbi:ComEC/Rec2 family competence protein [Pararhizobium mangrovi]|nr:ComEC/Rec2 family competence protein [Pararhizobium mangrovi]
MHNDPTADRVGDRSRMRAASAGAMFRGIGEISTWVRRQCAEEARYGQPFLFLPVFAVFGAAGIFAAARPVPVLPIALGLLQFAMLALFAHARGRAWAPLVLAVAAVLTGMLAASAQIERRGTILLDGEVTTRLHGLVVARENDADGNWRYLVRIADTHDPTIHRPPQTVRLLARGRAPPVEIGQEISGLARLMPPSGPVMPGEFDFAFNAYFHGIGAVGFFYGPPAPGVRLPASELTLGLRFHRAMSRLRGTIDHRIRTVLPGANGAFASALVTAHRRAIPDHVVAALRASGLAHILAISGLHMALVAGTLFLFVRRAASLIPSLSEAFPVKKIAAVAALVVATAYLVLSGGAVSTIRAWLMLAIMLLAICFDRPAITLRNVALAAGLIVLTNPAAVVGPSFQMSFAATLALVATYTAWRGPAGSSPAETGSRGVRVLRGLVVGLGAIALTSLVAGFATGIFAAYHFHRVALLGVIGNLAAMPLVTLVVMPLGLVATLAMPFGLDALALKGMGLGLTGVIRIAETVQALGGTAATGRVPPAILLLFVVGLVLATLLRSRLRLLGIVMLVGAGMLVAFPVWRHAPDIVIAGDGGMVGLPRGQTVAVDRKRPPGFIMDQWTDALAGRKAKTPVFLETANRPGKPDGEGETLPPKDAARTIRKVLQTAASGTFTCLEKEWCATTLDNGARIVTLRDPALLGAACDLADIVVTDRPVRMEHCHSGALLYTARTLRHSGAVTLSLTRLLPSSNGEGLKRNAKSGPVHGATRWSAASYRVIEHTALGGIVRAWTRQRYYDWRTARFDFAHVPPRTRRLMIATD